MERALVGPLDGAGACRAAGATSMRVARVLTRPELTIRSGARSCARQAAGGISAGLAGARSAHILCRTRRGAELRPTGRRGNLGGAGGRAERPYLLLLNVDIMCYTLSICVKIIKHGTLFWPFSSHSFYP